MKRPSLVSINILHVCVSVSVRIQYAINQCKMHSVSETIAEIYREKKQFYTCR